MKILIGCDHAGLELKDKLVPFIKDLGFEVEDKGAYDYNEEDDYNDFIVPVAREVSQRPNDARGIVIGGSGQGEAMCANRFRHVRATVYYGDVPPITQGHDSVIKDSRADNDSNILSIGARFVTAEQAMHVVKEWLEEPFSGAERHTRRITKLDRPHE
jgi:ribose 5-phosphate isomerase B